MMMATGLIRKARGRILRVAADALPSSLVIRRGTSGRKQVALTFDDGPDPMTGAYLDVLARYAARATFFVVGMRCAERPKDVLDIVRRGHEVAGHGFSHRKFPSLLHRELSEELERTSALLPPASTPYEFVRPPTGAVSPRSLLYCKLAGYTTVLWSLDSNDWQYHDAGRVASEVEALSVRPGEIVLLHEGQTWTLEALPTIIESLQKAGYELVTVGELLAP